MILNPVKRECIVLLEVILLDFAQLELSCHLKIQNLLLTASLVLQASTVIQTDLLVMLETVLLDTIV